MSSSRSTRSEMPGRTGAMPTPASMPASTSTFSARRRSRVREHAETRARQTIAPLRGLIRIGGGADRHELARPRLAQELVAQHVRDVDLHADARAVTVVERPVGAQLVRAHVAVRAAMD